LAPSPGNNTFGAIRSRDFFYLTLDLAGGKPYYLKNLARVSRSQSVSASAGVLDNQSGLADWASLIIRICLMFAGLRN
jgi:hypothetical protein